jgi:hypothetical protein
LSGWTGKPGGTVDGSQAAEFGGAAFYCVSSGMFFLGAVALINSLRVVGHTEPIFVLDCGLSPAQRELLSAEATVIPALDDSTPFLLKTVAPLRHPAGVMVLIDADIIVTRPLTKLIETTAEGRVTAVEHGQDRFFPEWGKFMGGTARHRRYVSSSLVLLGGRLGSKVIRLMDEIQGRIEIGRTPYSGQVPDYAFVGGSFSETATDDPFFFADQDVLNAVLATEVDPDRVDVLDRPAEAIPPFTGLRVIDQDNLQCAYEDGTEPYALHHFLPMKPWLEPTFPGVYTQLLVRLLRGGDVTIRVPPRELPPHLRPGLLAALTRGSHIVSERFRTARDRLRSPGEIA